MYQNLIQKRQRDIASCFKYYLKSLDIRQFSLKSSDAPILKMTSRGHYSISVKNLLNSYKYGFSLFIILKMHYIILSNVI